MSLCVQQQDSSDRYRHQGWGAGAVLNNKKHRRLLNDSAGTLTP